MGGYMDYALYQKISKVTLGKQPADLVLKNLKLVNDEKNMLHNLRLPAELIVRDSVARPR